MKKICLLICLVCFLGGIFVNHVYASDANSSNSLQVRTDDSSSSGRLRSGPPPEAYAACKGKQAGATASFVNPRGETLTGTCEQEGSQLVLRPDRNKGQAGAVHHGPPPEAYKACEGKSAGSTSQFVNPRGETVTGTCANENGKMVLRPNFKK